MNYIEKAKKLVIDYYNNNFIKHIHYTVMTPSISDENVHVVWFCKTLQNWKVLISTNIDDGMYYEVTYNGNKNETYIDAYKKWENVCIKD